MQVLDDLGGDDVGGGEVGGVLERLVLEPEDVEVGLVALDQVVVGERVAALALDALVAV